MSNIKSPLTPKTAKPDGSSLERSFSAKSSSTKRRDVVSRYLRPSTGSCHDHCKYGKKEESEAKERRPIRERIKSKALDSDGRNSVAIEIFLPGKKSYGAKLGTSSQVKGHVSDCDEIVKHEVSAKLPGDVNSVELETNDGQYNVVSEDLSSGKKAPRTQVPPSSNSGTFISDPFDVVKQEIGISHGIQNDGVGEITDAQNPVDTGVSVEMKKPLNWGISASRNNNKHKAAEPSIRSGNSMEAKVLAKENQKSVIQHKSGGAKPGACNSSGITKKKPASSSEKLKASPDQAPPKYKGKCVMVDAKPPVVKSLSTPSSSGFKNSKMNSVVGTGMKFGTSKTASKQVLNSPASAAKVAVRKVWASPAISSNLAVKKMMPSPSSEAARPVSGRGLSLISRKYSSSLKVGSPTKNNKRKNAKPSQPEVEVEEKTLYVVKMDLAKKSSDGNGNENYAVEPHSVPSSSSSTSFHPNPDVVASHEKVGEEKSIKDKSLSEHNESFDREGKEVVKKGFKRMPKKASKVASERSPRKPVKLSFQRGKVLDTHSQSNSPRRLKFRRVRIMGANQNAKVEVQRKSFKRRVEVVRKTGEKASPGKIALRHQDTLQKKDAQGLFNNVIEETASKLVESRKSKVKALVGAFETVISLQ